MIVNSMMKREHSDNGMKSIRLFTSREQAGFNFFIL